MQKLINVVELGEILITKKSNAKRMILRIDQHNGITVTIPYYATYKNVEKFILENTELIKEKLQKVSTKKQYFTPDSIFITNKYQTRFIEDAQKEFLSVKIHSDYIDFFYNKSNVDFYNDEVQQFIIQQIIRAIKFEAQLKLPDRLKFLSEKYKIPFKSIKIGTAATKWGSCSSKNDIILSCRLILLPQELIDYVLLHELSHVYYKNHSKDFYDFLNNLVAGKSEELNSRLKKISNNIVQGDYRI